MTHTGPAVPASPPALQPVSHPISQPYWDGLKQHRLLIQRCAACGTLRHYPRPVCSACFSMEADWAELSGKGVIHSWTVTHHPFSVAMREQLPLILIAVELDEGVRMHAPLRGQEPDVLRIGLPVQLIFESSGTETVYPAFVLAE